jgi:hypothetical protein
MKKESRKTVVIAVGASLAFVAIAVIAGIASENKGRAQQEAPATKVEQIVEPAKPDTAEEQEPSTVFFASRMFMEKKLLDPASARWPEYGDEGTKVGFAKKSQLWIIKSYVISRNGFGGMTQTFYVMSLDYIPGEGWRMDDLETNP